MPGGVPGIGHPELQRSEPDGAASSHKVPALRNAMLRVAPDLVASKMLLRNCHHLLPFGLLPYCLWSTEANVVCICVVNCVPQHQRLIIITLAASGVIKQ